MLRTRLHDAITLDVVRDRMPARLQVQDLQDPASTDLILSAWVGTVARVLARGPALGEDDFELALEAVFAGVVLKLEQALYPEQVEAGGPRSYLVAEYLGLLEDVGKVSDSRTSGASVGGGSFSGTVSLGAGSYSGSVSLGPPRVFW